MENNEDQGQLTRRNIFTVPEGYFDRLEQDIRQRTATPQPSAFRLSPFNLKLAGVAAMVTVAAWLFLPEPAVLSPEELLSGVEAEHLEAYVAENTGPDAEDILLPGSLTDADEINTYFQTDTLF